MKFKEGNIPLYFQFFLKVKNDIVLGELEPGSRVPTIDELNRRYALSHATIRRALALLEKEGLIIKKRGLGIIVRDEIDLPIWNPSSFLDLAYSILKEQTPHTLFCNWVEPPRRIEKYFGDQPGVYRHDRIFKIRRLWISKDDPRRKRVTDAYFSSLVVSRVGEDRLSKMPLMLAESENPTFPFIKIRQTLRPWICDIETAELLEIPDGSPVFHRTWITLNPNDEALTASETITTANSLVRNIETEFPVKTEAR